MRPLITIYATCIGLVLILAALAKIDKDKKIHMNMYDTVTAKIIKSSKCETKTCNNCYTCDNIIISFTTITGKEITVRKKIITDGYDRCALNDK